MNSKRWFAFLKQKSYNHAQPATAKIPGKKSLQSLLFQHQVRHSGPRQVIALLVAGLAELAKDANRVLELTFQDNENSRRSRKRKHHQAVESH